MLFRAIAGVLAAQLVLAPWASADPQTPAAGPLAASATREAEQAAAADPPRRWQVRHAPLWTGVGLIVGTGIPLLVASMDEGCQRRACRNGRRFAHTSAVGMGITGVALISIGLKGRREPSSTPTLEIDEGRAAIVQRIRF